MVLMLRKLKILAFPFCIIALLSLKEYIFCNSAMNTGGSLRNFHAVIEIIERTGGRKEILTKREEWFRKPDMIRREIFTPGIGKMKKVFIYDGENHYSYFPLSGEYLAYEEYFDDKPSFYANKLSKKVLDLIDKQNPKILAQEERLNGIESYIVSDRVSEDNQIINMTVWIGKENFLPLKWEKNVYNSDGQIIFQESCRYIEYDIQLPVNLFKIPNGYKIAKQTDLKNGFLKKPFTPQVIRQKLTEDRIEQLLSQEKELREIINKYPENAEAYAQLGNLYLLKKDYKEAIKLLNNSLELDPKQKNVYISLSEVYFITGEITESIKCMEKAIELASNNAYNYYRLGQLYEKAGLLEKAVSLYKRALELQPDDFVNDEGVVYRINGIRKKYFDAYMNAKKGL